MSRKRAESFAIDCVPRTNDLSVVRTWDQSESSIASLTLSLEHENSRSPSLLYLTWLSDRSWPCKSTGRMLTRCNVSSVGSKGSMVCGVDVGKNLYSGGDFPLNSQSPAKISQRARPPSKNKFLRCLFTRRRIERKLTQGFQMALGRRK